LERIPLSEKIEFLLTDLLEFHGFTLEKIRIEEEDVTESDSDY
jgi:hypothetical protein